jgi:hypothetical protein
MGSSVGLRTLAHRAIAATPRGSASCRVMNTLARELRENPLLWLLVVYTRFVLTHYLMPPATD